VSAKRRGSPEAILARIYKGAAKGVEAAALFLRNDVVRTLVARNNTLTSGAGSSQPGEPPARVTGSLHRSIVVVNAHRSKAQPRCLVGSKLKYARIHEFGGRIVAKAGKALIIPLNDTARRMLRNANGKVRSLNLRLIKTSRGVFLVKDFAAGEKLGKGIPKAKGAGSMLLFMLKKSVIMPARPYMRPAVARTAQDRLKIIRYHVKQAFLAKAA